MGLVEARTLYVEAHKLHSSDSARRIDNGLRCLKFVADIVPFKSVVDFGCGIGGWLKAAQLLGAETVKGFEGEWIETAEVVVSRDVIEIRNLESEIPDLQKSFDLAISIEVAEHLAPDVADAFVSALTNASSYVLFSAAIPGQGGVGHINEQPLRYWVDKFWRNQYVPLEIIRPYIVEQKEIYGWLRQNLIMFVDYAEFLRNPKLHRFARPLEDFELRYVIRR